MRITPEEVLQAVRQLGPVVPNKIKQHLAQPDSMLINIYLSDLQKEGKVRLTHVQLGTSSFAYTPEHIPKLESLIDHLNEKDRRVAKRLKEEQIMRASTQDPLTRVALQNIKDFAKPLHVKTTQGEETFYKWYLLSTEEAQEKIKRLLGIQTTQQEVPTPRKEEVPQDPPEKTNKQQPRAQQKPSAEQQKKAPTQQKTEQQQALIQAESDFAQQLLTYFKDKNITVLSLDEVRKNSEIDAKIRLPTPVGNITYYCKAKSKKSSNDGDLAAAILTAKSKMLPALYITTGTVTKKAKENNELQEITVVELGNSN